MPLKLSSKPKLWTTSKNTFTLFASALTWETKVAVPKARQMKNKRKISPSPAEKVELRNLLASINATSQIFIFFAVSTPTENLKISKKFVDWMNEKSNLRTICEEGKGKYDGKN